MRLQNEIQVAQIEVLKIDGKKAANVTIMLVVVAPMLAMNEIQNVARPAYLPSFFSAALLSTHFGWLQPFCLQETWF